MTTTTPVASVTVVCQSCKHLVTLRPGEKAAVCPYCAAKVSVPATEKVGTK